jgi:hypothetical protein
MGFKIQTDKHYLIKVSQDNGHWEPEIVKERVAKFLKYTRINFVNKMMDEPLYLFMFVDHHNYNVTGLFDLKDIIREATEEEIKKFEKTVAKSHKKTIASHYEK